MKMYLLEVFIEIKLPQLNRPFTYVYQGPEQPLSGMRVMVPFQKQSLIGYITKVDVTDDFKSYQAKSPFPILPIDRFIDDKPILTQELLTLVDHLATQEFASKIALLQAMLPPSLFPTKRSLKSPKIAYEKWLIITPLAPLPEMTPRQRLWWQMVSNLQKVKVSEIKSRAMIAYLIASKLAYEEKLEKRRFAFEPLNVDHRPTLTQGQQNIITEINQSNDAVYLLEGVTGSGKTEVYLNLSEAMINQGKTVLMIVPEIALTPIMMSYYYQRFGKRVAIFHSGLTPAEKFDEYRRIIQGEIAVVVGARSAVFAPLSHIGLIILDEEHSETYKQDTPPFYHAREVARWRGQYHQCKVIMGTATPSLESRARAMKGRYHHLSLQQRVFDQAKPTTTIVDMRRTELLSSRSSIFSHPLLKAIQTRLEKKEQVILLVNRRGYAQSVICRQCQEVLRCPSCQIPLAYHASIHSLKCHYCSYIDGLPSTCPSCQTGLLMKQGFGTEQVEKVLRDLYPHSRILRLDTDVSGIKSQMLKTLKTFQDHQADILVGTQMVAKGHDFPRVTLVGVMLADLGLHVPHYRATERTFQLLAQVVGRTGRGLIPGEAIIQTTMPDHYAITLGARQDYQQFYTREMKERKAMQYPPFFYLARFELTSNNQNLVDETALDLTQLLKQHLHPFVEVIGPNLPYPEFFAGVYRRRILMKYKDLTLFHEKLSGIHQLLLTKKSVKILLNLDPYDH
jgi:primosomal protein N' (replication factor Y) (superfamily II helicase)